MLIAQISDTHVMPDGRLMSGRVDTAPFLERAAFLSPARPLRELWLLMSLGHDESLSQHRLARRVGLSPARVNEYLRELEERGWVAREGETNRTIRYRLTEAGRSARRDAFLAFCGEMVRLYGHTKLPFRAALSELAASGLKRRPAIFATR